MTDNVQNDHDILVRNTTLTEQISQQLPTVLQQLARGNERFQDHEHRIAALERALPERDAAIRNDLVRSVAQATELRRDSLEAALAPLKTDLAQVHRLMIGVRKSGGWIVGVVGAAAAIVVGNYLAHLVGL